MSPIALRSGALLSLALGGVVSCGGRQDENISDSPQPQASAQVVLPGRSIPQFVQALPLLSAAGGTMASADDSSLTLRMCEFAARILPPGTLAGDSQPTTRVFGYILGDQCPSEPQDTYIGPVLINQRGRPTSVRYVNELGSGSTTGVLAWKHSVDQTLHWADPLNGGANHCAELESSPEPGSECARTYDGPIPAVAHLHGGEVPPELDGGPEEWFTSDGAYHGPAYYSAQGAAPNEAIYRYPNRQEAAPLWFHDHVLGITRVNVFAGLAGAYLITDPELELPTGLSAIGLSRDGAVGPDEITIPLVIQDRTFDTEGQLVLPAATIDGVLMSINPEHPYWVPEFTGDTIVVNGKAWPYLEVEPKRYRFWFINGSNARAYAMTLEDDDSGAEGPPLYVIATDGGYLDRPVAVAPPGKLVILPGERYEAIIDFSGVALGSHLVLKNTAKAPFPAGDAVQGSSLGRIVQFRVVPCASGECGDDDRSFDPASGSALRSESQKLVRLVDPDAGRLLVSASATRQLTLNEVMDEPETEVDPVTGELTQFPGGPLEVLLNNTQWVGESPRHSLYADFTPVSVDGTISYYSELPEEGTTELWELVNLTADAHPIHLHLAQFQLVNRQSFNEKRYAEAYASAFPAVSGSEECTGGVYCAGFGPPLDYRSGNPAALGGNPDVGPYLQGPVRPPIAYEAGWKDTVIALPGQVTRIAVRWAPTDLPVHAGAPSLHYPFDPSSNGERGYVWHCHIIDHEDNEMMRPTRVRPNPLLELGRPLLKGIDY